MKLIFLDIDGVLNKKSKDTPKTCVIEENHLDLLAKLVQKSGAEVVLSSSWRLAADEPWRDQLLRGGVSVSDQTVRLNGNNRQREILLYLEAHKDVESFVILDDQVERFGKLKKNRVLVNPRKGLTEANVSQALKIMGIPSE